MDKATVKGHGFVEGQTIEFYGMGKDLPSEQPTIVKVGKLGNKYFLVTVEGEIMTWEFGTSASIWAAPYYPVKVGDRVEDVRAEVTYTVTEVGDTISLRVVGSFRDGIEVPNETMILSLREEWFVVVSELGGKSAMADTEAWFEEIVKISEATMTPEVGDTVYHGRTGHEGVISDVWSGNLLVSWHDGSKATRTLPGLLDDGYEVIPAAVIENDMTLRGVQPRVHALPANTTWRMARGKRKATRRQARRNHGARA